jgi:hypothetical protein
MAYILWSVPCDNKKKKNLAPSTIGAAAARLLHHGLNSFCPEPTGALRIGVLSHRVTCALLCVLLSTSHNVTKAQPQYTGVAFERAESRQLYTRTYMMLFYSDSFLRGSLSCRILSFFSIHVLLLRSSAWRVRAQWGWASHSRCRALLGELRRDLTRHQPPEHPPAQNGPPHLESVGHLCLPSPSVAASRL